MTDWPIVFLGIIAVSTLLMAALQLGTVIYAARATRRVEELAQRIEQDFRPLLSHLTDISRDTARTIAMAATQAERMDAIVADANERVERTLAHIQSTVTGPTRQGAAIVAAVRTTIEALLRRTPGPADHPPSGGDDDPLFIG